MGVADPRQVRAALCKQRDIEIVDPAELTPQPEALSALPPETASRHKLLPLAINNGSIQVVMADPFDRQAIDVVRLLTGRKVLRVYGDETALKEAIGKHYGSNVSRMIADLGDEQPAEALDDETNIAAQLQDMAREPTVVNLVDLIIHEAIEARASDIHIEPFEKALKAKYRIDGLLYEMSPPPKHLQQAIASRIKIMAGMNIAERFVPQDGHITFMTEKGKIDIRVATAPTVFGESIVLRILDKSAALFSLDELGLGEAQLNAYFNLLHSPHGIVLVTGPTGSGKSTTLYASLTHIYSPELKIITIEDPVEYQLEGVNQMPVNRKRGLGFADGLRAILRQDPDIVMVGEIRDRETADIAIRSALTGHMVFSTLHTNDACGAITRLTDMGVEPFLIASSLRAVLAQRLVRRICPHCKREATPSPAMLERLGHRRNGTTFFEGAGCRECRRTGYLGRVGIFELLRVTDSVRDGITRRESSVQISARLPAEHLSMAEDGYTKAAAGLTTLSEVFRVTQEA
ncbi:MAG: type II/IV secretion system protein [Phycisphaeraceae bacterium]|nr:type II/IV secretion system protein [Phycisphaeraceae bacterium]